MANGATKKTNQETGLKQKKTFRVDIGLTETLYKSLLNISRSEHLKLSDVIRIGLSEYVKKKEHSEYFKTKVH